jgi:PKD repeat protein/glucose/arabinose dehydrogenase
VPLRRLRRASAPRLALLASVTVLAFVAPVAAVVPFGFTDEVAVSGFDLPVSVRFTPDGRMFVAEKAGLVWVVDSTGTRLPAPLVDLVDEVHAGHDKGMLGMELHPDFATNGWIYFLYNVDPIYGEPDEHSESATWSRATRYTVVADTVDTASRLVLLGNDATDGIANCHKSHSIGTIAFGNDGSLLVGAGEGAHYDFTDGGQDVTPYDPECAAVFGTAQDVGALRSQVFESLAGKILRLDPATGLGLPDNPWWDGDPASFPSRMWAIGLRNPFRFTVRWDAAPLGRSDAVGPLYIGDVGAGTWEELDVAHGGENFGWPCFEGPNPNSGFQSNPNTSWFCSALAESTITPPLLPWHHSNPGSIGFVGNASSGAIFYDGTSFPVTYHGKCFFADYGDNWIRVADIDAQDQLIGIEPFASGLAQPVELRVDPATGDLVYVSITQGAVRRIRFTLGNVPPVVVASADPTSGPLPLDVQFSSDGTYDPNGDPFTLEWDFGDGSAVSNAPNPIHQYTDLGTFEVWLKAADDSGNVDSTSVVVQTINLPPSVAITSPPNGYEFQVDEVIPLTAAASDPEGTPLAWAWSVDLIHNDHPHPGWFTSTAESTSFVAEGHGDTGDRYSYRIRLTVTDADAAAASDTTWIVPEDQGPNSPPIAAFAATPHRGPAPLVVQLDASPSVDPDDDLMLFEWDFGDGTGGAGTTTSHIFADPGLYTITLTAMDPGLATGTATATVLAEPPGALARWDLDEGGGTVAADSSGQGRDGTVDGASWVAGVSGSALDFDGANDFVGTGESFLSDRAAFTLAAWVRPRTTGSRIGLIGQNDCVEMGFISAGSLQIWTPGGGSLGAPWPFPLDEWHHVAVTGDGAGLEIFLDGVSVATSSAATTSYGSSGYPVNFGGGGIYDATGNWFDGAMDEVRIYGTSLEPASIALLAALPPANAAPVPDAGPDALATATLPHALLGAVGDDGNPSPPGQTTVVWAQVSGPAAATIFSPTTLFTQVVFPAAGIYAIELTADDGALSAADTVLVTVDDPTSVLAGAFEGAPGLRGVAPNPLRGRTTVSYAVPRDGVPVRVAVHSVDGRRVTVLSDGPGRAGLQQLVWNGRDRRGAPVSSGVYFVVADVNGQRTTRKVTVVH